MLIKVQLIHSENGDIQSHKILQNDRRGNITESEDIRFQTERT